MTLPEIYERIGSLPSGGYLTIDSRFDKGYIYSLIHSARSIIVMERFKANMSIPPVYYQPYTPTFEKVAQDSDKCCTIFYGVPTIIGGDGRTSGLGYVGTINGKPKIFKEVGSRAELAAMFTDRTMRNLTRPYVLIGGESIEVYSNETIKNFSIEAIFKDPTQLPTYDIPTSEYPMDIADIAKMETYLMQGAMGASIKTIADRIANSRDDTQP